MLKGIYICIFLVLNVFLTAQTLFPYRNGDKWYYVNDSLKPISKKTYSFIFPFLGSQAIVQQKKKYGVVDNKENIIVPINYDTITFSYPYFDCVQNKKLIRLDLNGKVVEIVYGGCGGTTYSESMFWTYRKNNKIGLLDFRKSNLPDSLPNIYDELHEYNAGIAFARIGKKWGTITSLGDVITNFILDSVIITDYSGRDRYKLTKYISKNGIGFINGRGKVVSEAKYKDYFFNYDHFSLVKTADGRMVYIDDNGREYYSLNKK